MLIKLLKKVLNYNGYEQKIIKHVGWDMLAYIVHG